MAQKPLDVVVVAGETSGDRQGAALMDALRVAAAPRPLKAWGIGGENLRSAGVTLLHNSDTWASIGVANAVRHIPKWIGCRADLQRQLLRTPPDLLVLIDSGAFNVPLGRWARKQGLCPVFYYFPPGSWRRSGQNRNGNLIASADRIVTPFPWSADALRRSGADAYFVGHQLLDLVRPSLSDTEFYDRLGLDPHRPLVCLMPGSRHAEIVHILPALIGAAGEISRRIPGVQFALALASGTPRELIEQIVRREQQQGGRAARLQVLIHQAGKLVQTAQQKIATPLLATNEGLTVRAPITNALNAAPTDKTGPAPLVICEKITYDVMARCDLVITKSGTSTLEAAILNKPMIIVYRGSKLMELEWMARKSSLKIDHIGLPNILAGERMFTELLQNDASPETIAEYAVEMLLSPERLLRLKERTRELIRTQLGSEGGIERAASLLYELAGGTGAQHE